MDVKKGLRADKIHVSFTEEYSYNETKKNSIELL